MLAKFERQKSKDQFIYLWRLVKEVYKHFTDRNCQQSAGALTYVSLFALVPVLTLVYSMVSILPASQELESQLQQLIFSNLVPNSGQALQSYLASFTDRARALTLPGVVMLVVTAYLMLKNIEKTFNHIWGVGQARSGVSSFLIYWAILTLGPLLLGAGLVMSTYLLSVKLMVGELDGLGVLPILYSVLPGLLAAIAFTLFFTLVPNCHVPVRDAAIGGIVIAVLFELAKDLFTDLVAKTSYELIYGAFAIVPLFLLWIYILWALVLAGAVLVRSISLLRIEARSLAFSDFVAAIIVLTEVAQGMDKGESIRAAKFFNDGIHPEQFNRVRALLMNSRLLAETKSGRYVLGRRLVQIKLMDIARLVKTNRTDVLNMNISDDHEWAPILTAQLNRCRQVQEEALSITLADLVDERQPSAENPPMVIREASAKASGAEGGKKETV